MARVRTREYGGDTTPAAHRCTVQPKKATPMAQHIPAQRQPDHGALGELADRAVQVLRAHYDTVQHGYCDVCHLEWPCDTVLRADSNLALLH
jgi:hypothetical protein